MELEIYPRSVFVGSIFKATVRCKLCDDIFRVLKLVTVRIIGIAEANGKRLQFLESVAVQLPIEKCQTEVIYRCVIPQGTPPSIKARSFEIHYFIKIEVYHSSTKNAMTKAFEVLPVGLGPLRSTIGHDGVIHDDMIRIGEEDDTAFGEIVQNLRTKREHCSGTIDEIVGAKVCMLKNFEEFMNRTVERYRSLRKGDVYFYTCMEEVFVEEGRSKTTAQDSGGEILKVECGKFCISEDTIVIYYKRDIYSTKIFLKITEYINDDVSGDTEILIEEFCSRRCVYKIIPISFGSESRFSFSCTFFAIKFAYKIVLDDFEVLVPIKKISSRAKVRIK